MTERAAAAAPAPRLDELMLAMDVVDTLRHQEDLVTRELGQEDRDEVLMARLRAIYEGQGLAVSDRILRDGIRALKEQRFTYVRRGTPSGRFLAHLWVKRRAVGIAVMALAVAIGLALGWNAWERAAQERVAEAQRVELTQTLPDQLRLAGDVALAEATTAEAEAATRSLIADGERVLARGDAAAARATIAELETLRQRLAQVYHLRIVSREGEASGVFRIPEDNPDARNYYLIVEPVTTDGEVLSLPVLNEETGAIETVSMFGVRVPGEVYEEVRQDKADDGIIQDNILAEKPRGALDPVYLMPVETGRITRW
jgi:hypothetical protein